jgi:hypothetical protein
MSYKVSQFTFTGLSAEQIVGLSEIALRDNPSPEEMANGFPLLAQGVLTANQGMHELVGIMREYAVRLERELKARTGRKEELPPN